VIKNCNPLFIILIFSDFTQLEASNAANNLQNVFDLAEKEFGIKPLLTVEDMLSADGPDKTLVASYLTCFYEYFRKESIRPPKVARKTEEAEEKPRNVSAVRSPRSPRQPPGGVNRVASRFRHRKVSHCAFVYYMRQLYMCVYCNSTGFLCLMYN
jgi:hypothetical protein